MSAMRAIGLAAVICGAIAAPCLGQGTAAATASAAAPAAVRPVLTAAEMERFLLNADIKATIKVSKGVTKARQVRMSDGQLTHDAQVQDVDISMPFFQVDPKHSEVNFKDSYRYNIAAYRLSLLLGLDNVPMSVERVVDHKPSAVTWWLDDVKMEEGDRKKLKTQPYGPNPVRTLGYLSVMRVFDELIQNRDRNLGNMMWSSDWKLWMIDHTRAFRLGKDLLSPKTVERCERSFFAKMKELNAPQLTETMGKSLTKDEIAALLARRDALVKLIEGRIAEFGEDKILFTIS
ncbi:MAG TPA: hypothetical protein VH436_03125 [Vicinamibacterales bacterium]